jgi:hypothetical protein
MTAGNFTVRELGVLSVLTTLSTPSFAVDVEGTEEGAVKKRVVSVAFT